MNWIPLGVFLCLLSPDLVPLALVCYLIGFLED